MVIRATNRSRFPSLGSVTGPERWGSILAGLGLTLLAARSRGGLRRAAASTLGLSLLTRGATGYCGVKAAVSGEASVVDGAREQWQRVRGVLGKGAAAIDSLDTLYFSELQELYSAESQLAPLLHGLTGLVEHPAVSNHFRGYSIELESRRDDLGRILGSYGEDPREHLDSAMRALVNETKKMAQVCGGNVRDAALVASVQKLMHYKIASYGTVAAYAKILGRIEDASRFAEYAERDEAIDAELSDLAVGSLNPQASVNPKGATTSPKTSNNTEARAH
jgi:ferritin-like metal-binding protein YciE